MLKECLTSLSIVFSLAANSAIVSHGSLSTNNDGSTSVIADSQNNVEWLRLDVLAPLNYADTLAVLNTQDGGGWSVATSTEASLFIDALFIANNFVCNGAPVFEPICGTLTGWSDGDLGQNYTNNWDLTWFLNDAGDAGYVRFYDSGLVGINESWGTIQATDSYATGGGSPLASWLLVRDVTAVPIPTAALLFGSALIGLVRLKRNI